VLLVLTEKVGDSWHDRLSGMPYSDHMTATRPVHARLKPQPVEDTVRASVEDDVVRLVGVLAADEIIASPDDVSRHGDATPTTTPRLG